MLGKYNRRTVRASSGAVAPGATVSFFWQSNGTPAMVYADQDGNTPLGSSVQSDADGRIAVFVTPGLYRIVVTLDGSVIEELTHEPIVGQLAYADPDSYALRSELKLHDEDIQLVVKSVADMKLAGGPRLASGRALTAVEVGMLADTGALLKTSEYHSGTSLGGGEYHIRTLASYRTEIGDGAWVPDGYGSHYLLGGAIYVAVLQIENEFSIAQCGARPESGFDNGPMFTAIGANFSAYQGKITIPPGVFETNSTFMVPPDCTLVGAGKGVSVISAKDSAGSFTGNGVVRMVGAQPTAISGLASAVSEGGVILSFTSSHGLSVGENILIYNPTDFSWHQARPVYRAGEYATVAQVLTSTSIELEAPLYDGYLPADVNIYVCRGYAKGSMRGFSVVAPGAASGNNIIRAIDIDYSSGGTFKDLGASNSDNTSMSLAHSLKVNLRSIDAHQWSKNPGFGTQYGLSIGNCQAASITGQFTGWRHGITTGGANDFSVTNRGIRVYDFVAKSRSGDIAAADWHGNTEFSVYENGQIFGGGLNIAGDNNRISNIEGHGDNMMVILGREILGCNHVMENCRFWTGRNDTTRALINIGGNESPMNDVDTKRGGTFVFNDIKVDAPNNERHCLRITNRGFVGEWHISADNIEYIAASSNSVSFSVVGSSTTIGTPPATFHISNIRTLAGKTTPHISLGSADVAYTAIRGLKVSGHIDVTTDTSSGAANEAVTFPKRFPKTPVITTNPSSQTTGGDVCLSYAVNSSATGFTARYARVDQFANFTGAVTRTISWTASLDEF